MADTKRPSDWYFDAFSAFRQSYEEHLLRESTSLAIADCLLRAVAELREDPITEDFVTVGGQRWYVKSVGGFRFAGEDIPEYLIGYMVEDASATDDALMPPMIYPLLVCKASVIGKVDAAARSREVVRLIERTLAQVDRRKAH